MGCPAGHISILKERLKTQTLNKTYLWWKFLCITAVFNICIWAWAIVTQSDMQHFSYAQPILSGIYVFVCAFRSFLPRIDVERYCLFDHPLSSVMLGRSLATIAEVSFSAQCALLIDNLGQSLSSPTIQFIAYTLVPIIVLAQVSCWYATLTLNHLWHSIEEAAWVAMLALAAVCFSIGFFMLSGVLKVLMAIGIISCLGSAYIMLFIDIPMYLSRKHDSHKQARQFLSVSAGIKDALSRRVKTSDWDVWKKEVLWLSSYFTFGVWLSIGMVFVRF